MKNPELMKQLWLYEIKIITLLVIVLFVSITWFVSESIFSIFITKYIAIFGFLFFGVITGPMGIAAAFRKEVGDNTWNAQRMGCIQPSHLLLGKLIGPSLTSWGAAILCLLIYIGNSGDLTESLLNSVILCLVALIFQATSLNKEVIQVFRERTSNQRNSIIISIALIAFLLPHITDILIPTWHQLKTSYANPVWFSVPYQKDLFTLSVLTFIGVWAMFGAYRSLRLEIDIKATPSAYGLFVLSLGLLVTGFSASDKGLDALRMWLSCSAVIASAASYLAAISFPSGIGQFIRTIKYLRERQFKRGLQEAPLWLSSSILAIILASFSTMAGVDQIFTNEKITNTGSAALAISLLAFRDVLFLSLLQMHYSARQSSFCFLFFLVVLNKLIPLHGADTYLNMLTPNVFQEPIYVCGFSMIGIGLIGYMWRRKYQSILKMITQATAPQS